MSYFLYVPDINRFTRHHNDIIYHGGANCSGGALQIPQIVCNDADIIYFPHLSTNSNTQGVKDPSKYEHLRVQDQQSPKLIIG
jgi:hypothetical protein